MALYAAAHTPEGKPRLRPEDFSPFEDHSPKRVSADEFVAMLEAQRKQLE